MSKRIVALSSTILLLTLAVRALAQETTDADGKRTLRVGTLTSGLSLDGRMDELLWAAADSIASLTMVEPEEGGTPVGRTIVRVLADSRHVIVGVHCEDPDPKGIVSFSKARDSALDEEDHVKIVFDTFDDGRSGYIFAVNASGARFDGLVSDEGEGINIQWDAIWEAETMRDSTGWGVEFAIPVKSLTFGKDLASWGFNLERRVQRLQETDRWSGASLDYEIFQTYRAGRLVELPKFDLGHGLSIRPAAIGRMFSLANQPGPGWTTETDLDIALDVTKSLGPNLLSALTVNTDFAETEVDVRQINLTRFPIFFPEKRTFFLEGADIFEFGLGLDEESMLPFHTRRIGLLGLEEDEQAVIPINAGGKISGRIGNTNLGALVVNTDEVHGLPLDEVVRIDVPQTTMGAVRVNQNVLEESGIGILATFGDQAGRDDAWSAGADFVFATSGFRRDKNLEIGLWGLLNDRADLNGEKSAYGFRIDYPNDRWDTNFTTMRIGNGFDPSLGFVPRRDVHIYDFGLEFNPRPNWELVRQMFYELSGTVHNKWDNSAWESYAGTFKPFDWLFESGDQFDVGMEVEGDRPPAPFEISGDVDVPPGSYEWVRVFAGARAAEKRRVSGELRWDGGDYYNGDLQTFLARLTMRTSALFTLELTGERSDGTVQALPDDFEELESIVLVEKTFREQLLGVRLQLNISPDLQLSSLTQYDTVSRELGTNNRLRWTFSPYGDVFIVYNHNLIRRLSDDKWLFVSNELPVKVQYAFRF